MLSISHAVTGAALAVSIDNPFLSVPLVLLSHYLLDAVPHWDAGTGLTKGSKTPRLAILHELPDLFLAGLLVIVLFQLGRPMELSVSSLAPYWGAFLGLLPDFLEAPRNFLKKEPSWLTPFNRFHHSFHHSIPRPLDGLAPQAVLLVFILLLL
jgi:hypothetical protein